MTVDVERSDAIAVLPETVQHVPALLSAEFVDLDSSVVERTVAETYQDLADQARVVSFLPILTEKVARDHLERFTRRRHRAVAGTLSR